MPCLVMTGSLTPNSSTRFRMTSTACSCISAVIGTRCASLFGNRGYQPDQKRGPALQIEPEMNFLLERQERVDRESAQQQGQSRAQPTFRLLLIGQKVPREKK